MGRLCLLTLFSFFICFSSQAKSIEHNVTGKAVFLTKNISAVPADSVLAADSIHYHRKHKLIAALLAFPLGVFGTHRMYLGTSSKVPLIYIATFGGGFGVLPFIDFVLILLNKDVNTYAHNPRTFMWSKPRKK